MHLALQHADSQFPDQGSYPCPLQWKCRVLTIGLPEKFPRAQFTLSLANIPEAIPSPFGPRSRHIKPNNLRLYPLCPREQILLDIRIESLDQGHYSLYHLGCYFSSCILCLYQTMNWRAGLSCFSNPLHPYHLAVTQESFAGLLWWSSS